MIMYAIIIKNYVGADFNGVNVRLFATEEARRVALVQLIKKNLNNHQIQHETEDITVE